MGPALRRRRVGGTGGDPVSRLRRRGDPWIAAPGRVDRGAGQSGSRRRAEWIAAPGCGPCCVAVAALGDHVSAKAAEGATRRRPPLPVVAALCGGVTADACEACVPRRTSRLTPRRGLELHELAPVNAWVPCVRREWLGNALVRSVRREVGGKATVRSVRQEVGGKSAAPVHA
jgi:hypothetical protein